MCLNLKNCKPTANLKGQSPVCRGMILPVSLTKNKRHSSQPDWVHTKTHAQYSACARNYADDRCPANLLLARCVAPCEECAAPQRGQQAAQIRTGFFTSLLSTGAEGLPEFFSLLSVMTSRKQTDHHCMRSLSKMFDTVLKIRPQAELLSGLRKSLFAIISTPQKTVFVETINVASLRILLMLW